MIAENDLAVSEALSEIDEFGLLTVPRISLSSILSYLVLLVM